MIIKLLFSLCLTATLYGTIVGGIVYMINIILKKQLSGQFRFTAGMSHAEIHCLSFTDIWIRERVMCMTRRYSKKFLSVIMN